MARCRAKVGPGRAPAPAPGLGPAWLARYSSGMLFLVERVLQGL